MYSKKCPICEKEVYYKSKKSLLNSITKNCNCRECMGKVISEKRKGIVFSDEHIKNLSKAKEGVKLSEEHKKNIGIGLIGLTRSNESKKRYSDSKMGDKNPAKRQDVKDKIRESVLKLYLLNPNYKDNISKSLIKYFKNNSSYISYDELEGYKKYKNKVDRLTNKNKKKLLENWDGFDYYDKQNIKDNFILNYNHINYPTIDHKYSILYGFKNKFSAEFIGSVENLCFTKRIINSKKGSHIEQKFKDNLSK